MWNIDPIQIQAVLAIHRTINSMHPKVGLVEETKEGKTVGNNEMHHICVGARHKETQ
jgi:hypothetical protein